MFALTIVFTGGTCIVEQGYKVVARDAPTSFPPCPPATSSSPVYSMWTGRADYCETENKMLIPIGQCRDFLFQLIYLETGEVVSSLNAHAERLE